MLLLTHAMHHSTSQFRSKVASPNPVTQVHKNPSSPTSLWYVTNCSTPYKIPLPYLTALESLETSADTTEWVASCGSSLCIDDPTKYQPSFYLSWAAWVLVICLPTGIMWSASVDPVIIPCARPGWLRQMLSTIIFCFLSLFQGKLMEWTAKASVVLAQFAWIHCTH